MKTDSYKENCNQNNKHSMEKEWQVWSTKVLTVGKGFPKVPKHQVSKIDTKNFGWDLGPTKWHCQKSFETKIKKCYIEIL